MRYLSFCIFFFLSCNETSISSNDKKKYDRLPPPPYLSKLDIEKQCELIKQKKYNLHNGDNLYFYISDTITATRIIFEKILHEKYNLILRPIIDTSIERDCIKPYFDSFINKRFGLSINFIYNDVLTEVKKIVDSIGPDKIEKYTYIYSDTFPQYPGKYHELLIDVSKIKEKYKRKTRSEGTSVFYYKINKDGSISDIDIYEHVNSETDSLTKLIMTHLPHSWTPAFVNGKPVDFWMQYAIVW